MSLITTRREALRSVGCGFGLLAASALAQRNASGSSKSNPLAAKQPLFPPRAKRVIFIFMQGGPSQVDTFDYKPMLEQLDGENQAFDDARVLAKTKEIKQHRVFQSPWKFKQYGDCGQPVSELFPHIAKHVDDLCFLKGMHTDGVAHGPATLFMHTGSINLVRPSVGSWVLYGLGSENENLPGFITLQPSMGNGGPRNFNNAFLPAVYQGTAVGRAGTSAKDARIRNLRNDTLSPSEQLRQLEALRSLNAVQAANRPGDREFEAVINSYELAWRMQNSVPDILNLADEPDHVQKMYGIGQKATDDFGRQCLMARRLCEAGVRYIQVNYSDNGNNPRWDQHSNLEKHADHAMATDQPVAGLLADLKQRGLLEDTLVWWGGEFGRTPYAQSNGTGRDHNPYGFTIFLAGGGVKRGFSHGTTDEFGHHAIEGKVHMHDWHATLLHLLGLDHEELTFMHDGRPFRLTDVYGDVVTEILA
ncbi:MAG: DUF1501 domain-containing protein [Planctomycetota bacterium]